MWWERRGWLGRDRRRRGFQRGRQLGWCKQRPGACFLDTTVETFGFTDSSIFTPLPQVGASSLPANARANSGRILVDGCGVRVLADLSRNFSIHTWSAGASYVQSSTTELVDISEVVHFRKIGEDFAVVATDGDNRTYLYRMAGAGGPIQKVLSEPLVNDDFGMQSLAMTATHMYFNTYVAGPIYALRRAPISAFATGTLPLEAPMAQDQSDNARTRVHAWGDLIAFGAGHYRAECGTECSREDVLDPPNLHYVFAGVADTLYGWVDGKLIVRSRGASVTTTVQPHGVDAGTDTLRLGAVSADGTRVAVLSTGASGQRLHRIDAANTANPTGTTLMLPPTLGNVKDLWTNGKIVLVLTEHSADTKPIQVHGIAWGQ